MIILLAVTVISVRVPSIRIPVFFAQRRPESIGNAYRIIILIPWLADSVLSIHWVSMS